RIYAGDAVPQYVIVNLRDDQVEVFADPDPPARVYRQQHVAHRGERVALGALPYTALLVDDLWPGPPDHWPPSRRPWCGQPLGCPTTREWQDYPTSISSPRRRRCARPWSAFPSS